MLPFAIGVYLPVQLNACIMVGGLIRLVLDKIAAKKPEKKDSVNDGIPFCSGMIAGEGLIGILLAIAAVFGFNELIDFSSKIPAVASNIGSIVLFGLIILTVLKFSLWRKRK